MSSALNIGTTGLSASAQQMDVIGNNLANANTVGFKASETNFASMLSQSLTSGGGAAAVGQGVSVAAVSTLFGQGTFEATGNVTDMAIDGNGFFVTKDATGNTLYTRAGVFHVANDGLLVDLNGYKVQGHTFDTAGIVETQNLTELNLQDALSKPAATTYFGMGVTLNTETVGGGTFSTSQVVYDSQGAKHNLNTTFTKMEDSAYWGVQAKLDDTIDGKMTYTGVHFDSSGAMDAIYADRTVPTANVVKTSTNGTFTTPLTPVNIIKQMDLYKATTASIVLKYTAATSSWGVSGVSNGGYANIKILNPDATHVGVDLLGTGTTDMTFGIVAPNPITSWADGDTFKFDIVGTDVAKANNIVNFGTSLSNGATIGATTATTTTNIGDVIWNLNGITNHDAPLISSFATTSRIATLDNDGYAPGLLTSLSVNNNGIIEGRFSNGQRQNLARILFADFANLQGLNKSGAYFLETVASGASVANSPGAGGLGELRSNSLEMSNCDTAKEFIKMITAQRTYQSSAKIISTADQMLQTLMNVKQ